jgi:2'-5' RNA ligase
MNFSKFYTNLFEEQTFKFNSSQLDVNYFTAIDKIFKYGLNHIPDSKLASDDGRQMADDIHITVLYGIHSSDFSEFRKAVLDSGIKEIKVELGKINKFSKDEHTDVIYVEVSPDYNLTALRGFLKNNLKNTQTHEEYHPHVTLAYVKRDSCDHLIGNETFKGTKLNFSSITFSDKDGNKQVHYMGDSYAVLKEDAPSTVAPDSTATGQHAKRAGDVAKFKKEVSEKVKDELEGGEADHISDSNFDPKELKMGIKEEMEHTNDKKIAKEIAKDHLIEDPKYYSRMKLYDESVDPQTVNKYAQAKQKMLVHSSHGIWKDPHGGSYSWEGANFKKVDDGKTKDVADHLRTNGYSIKHHKDNILVSKKNSHVDKEDIDKHLSKHFKDKKFKSSSIKTTDTNGKEFSSVMVKHLDG